MKYLDFDLELSAVLQHVVTLYIHPKDRTVRLEIDPYGYDFRRSWEIRVVIPDFIVRYYSVEEVARRLDREFTVLCDAHTFDGGGYTLDVELYNSAMRDIKIELDKLSNIGPRP